MRDPIDRGRMTATFDKWEQEAEKKHAQAGEADEMAAEPQIENESAPDANEPAQTAGADEETAAAAAQPIETMPSSLTGSNEGSEEGGEEECGTGNIVGPLVGFLLQIIFFAALLFLACAEKWGFALPAVLHGISRDLLLVSGSAFLFLLASIFAVVPLSEGFLSLFGRANKTSAPCALAFLGGLAGYAAVVLMGGKGGAVPAAFYALSACACYTMESLSQLFAAQSQRSRNKSAGDEQYSCSARLGMAKSLLGRRRLVAVPEKAPAGRTSDDAPLPTGKLASVLSLVILVCGAAGALSAIYGLGKPVEKGLFFAAAVLCAGAPLAMGFAASFPFLLTASALRRRGAVLSGYGAVDAYGQADSLLLPERLLYPEGQIHICALRPMSAKGWENAALAAASVAKAADMALAPALMSLFDGAENFLRPVTDLRVYHEVGVEAQVDGHRILVGTRSLLRQKRVDLTGRMTLEVEAKYAVKGNDFLYLVLDDQPMALLILDYLPEKALAASLRLLTRAGMRLMISSADANITREQVADRFRLKRPMVGTLRHEQTQLFLKSEAKQPEEAALYIKDQAVTLVRAVSACARLKKRIRLLSMIQAIGVVADTVLVFLLFFWNAEIAEPLWVLAMQAVWLLPTLILSVFRRQA